MEYKNVIIKVVVFLDSKMEDDMCVWSDFSNYVRIVGVMFDLSEDFVEEKGE